VTRVLCTGDRQIGVGGPSRLADQEAIGHQIAQLAVDRDVDLILDGGDIFEGPTVDPEHLEAFIRPLEQLGGLIPIVAITGNGRHDRATREVTALAPLRHVPGLTIASTPQVVPVAGVAAACLPWVSVSRLVAARDGGDRDEANVDAGELLLRVAEGLRDECGREWPGVPCVLLAHWSISGAAYPNGLPVDGAREPILPLAGLEQLGFDAIVASHIHQPQHALRDGTWCRIEYSAGGPASGTTHPVFYTGSPQHHDHGDGGQSRGVWVLTFGEGAVVPPGSSAALSPDVTAEFVPLNGRRFVTVDADPAWLDDIARDGWHPKDNQLEEAIVRLRYTASRDQARRIDQSSLRQALLDAGARTVTVEPTIVREQTARIPGLDESLGELDALDLFLAQHPELEPLADRMRERATTYLEAVA
jgi:DNA repair exonuclease SbcCD nuclease subunit